MVKAVIYHFLETTNRNNDTDQRQSPLTKTLNTIQTDSFRSLAGNIAAIGFLTLIVQRDLRVILVDRLLIHALILAQAL